jgi:choline dehydrogenase
MASWQADKLYKVNVTTGTQLTAGNPDVSAATVHEYLHNQGGLLSSIGAGMGVGSYLSTFVNVIRTNIGVICAAFEKFPSLQRDRFSPSTRTFLSSFPQDWPEVEYLPLEYGSFPPDISTTDNYLTIGAALLTTSAKGNLTISSASILDDPVISPNWLLDVADQEQAVAAVERIRQIAFGSSIVQSEYLPGPDVNDRQKILAWCKDNMSLIYHATSTCESHLTQSRKYAF